MDPLNAFMAKSVPRYEDLFKAKHSDKQALMLFENYLCYRALLDVLSLRVSRWENLVKRKHEGPFLKCGSIYFVDL